MSAEPPASPSAPRWRGKGSLAGYAYAIGLGALVAAAAIKLALEPFLGTRGPFLLFLAAVMATAWYGGWKVAQFGAGRGEAHLGVERTEGARAERRTSESIAEDLEPEIEILYRKEQEARAAAEAANRVKDQFLATLSHELRTPLTAIVGWAYLLERGQLPPEEMARAIETIIQSAAAQNQIIDELLDVSRIATGKLKIELRPVDIATVVAAAIGTVTPSASAKGIRLQVIQEPGGSWVMGDPERLQQVFWNLFSNAIKFTSRNGRVRVSIETVGSNVEVVVADTGFGIDAGFLPRVFDRFTQDDSSSTRPARGLGLGLSIARQLVELHGGSILAESPGVGHGSTFTARLPRVATASPSPDPRAYATAGPIIGLEEGPDLTGIRVLVVEDHDDSRGLVEKVLETRGAIVKAASSAPEALDILGREKIDLLLSDIEMPGQDGYQLIEEVRQRPAHQGGSVPAAALTAYARTEDRLRALRAGFQLHLAKPVHPSELVTAVARLAGRRGGPPRSGRKEAV